MADHPVSENPEGRPNATAGGPENEQGDETAPHVSEGKAHSEPAGSEDAGRTDETLTAEQKLARSSADIQESRLNHLHKSIKQAQSLLAFSAEANVAVPEPVIKDITIAQNAFGKDAWSLEIEQHFWLAYKELASTLHPVTVTSIDWVATRAKRTSLTFIILGFLSLTMLVFAQVFWVYINNTSTQIQSSVQTLHQRNAEYAELVTTIDLLKRQVEPYALQNASVPVDDIEKFQSAQQRLIQSEGKLDVLNKQLDQIQRLLAAQYIILRDWVPELGGDPKPDGPGWFDSDIEKEAKRVALEKWYDQQGTERAFANEYLLAQAASILALMSTYVLPLLYGALGTVAYILRSVSRGINNRVLTDSAILNFWVRVPLGMLCGVAIGWFLSTDTLPTGWEAIQPLAFAFVAGYSVELIFTAMDRLVGAFSDRDQTAGARG